MRKRKPPKTPNALKVAKALDMPPETIPGIPMITVLGGTEATVCNYKGIVEYDNKKVVLNTSVGIFEILGDDLEIKTVTDVEITLGGRVAGFEIK